MRIYIYTYLYIICVLHIYIYHVKFSVYIFIYTTRSWWWLVLNSCSFPCLDIELQHITRRKLTYKPLSLSEHKDPKIHCEYLRIIISPNAKQQRSHCGYPVGSLKAINPNQLPDPFQARPLIIGHFPFRILQTLEWSGCHNESHWL